MAKVMLSVGGNVAAIRRWSGGAIRVRVLLLPPTTTNNYSSSSSSSSSYRTLLPTLGLGFNPPGRGRLAAAPIAMISTAKSEPHPWRRRWRRSIRANHYHHVNDSGSIDSPLINSMQTKIKEQLNAESVIVKDAYGDGRHVSIDVVSSVFEGESAVSRQRMVYKAIWEELQNTVHAVDQMTTKTPSEATTSK